MRAGSRPCMSAGSRFSFGCFFSFYRRCEPVTGMYSNMSAGWLATTQYNDDDAHFAIYHNPNVACTAVSSYTGGIYPTEPMHVCMHATACGHVMTFWIAFPRTVACFMSSAILNRAPFLSLLAFASSSLMSSSRHMDWVSFRTISPSMTASLPSI